MSLTNESPQFDTPVYCDCTTGCQRCGRTWPKDFVVNLEKPKEHVNHPSHYNQGKIEVIDAIEDWGLDFNEGNVVKYLARSRHKGKRLEDLKKAHWYLSRLVANEQARIAENGEKL